jgi:hypothetical protein
LNLLAAVEERLCRREVSDAEEAIGEKISKQTYVISQK